MKINYTVKKMTLRENSKEHIEKKLKKLDKFFSDDAEVSVVLKLENERVVAELTIRDKGTVYRAEDEKIDLIDSFDSAFDNMIKRIKKQRSRLVKRLRENAFENEYAAMAAKEDENEFKVIKSKHFPVKPISVQEAILQMELIGHKFFIFKNAETNEEINVVYLRNDGKYGLIQPE